jgi:hypothetical protein
MCPLLPRAATLHCRPTRHLRTRNRRQRPAPEGDGAEEPNKETKKEKKKARVKAEREAAKKQKAAGKAQPGPSYGSSSSILAPKQLGHRWRHAESSQVESLLEQQCEEGAILNSSSCESPN